MPKVIVEAENLKKSLGLNFIIYPLSKYLPNQEILMLYRKARIYLGVSISDGLSVSALEAMAFGAFPIQTNTATLSEGWIQDGENGFIIPANNISKQLKNIAYTYK